MSGQWRMFQAEIEGQAAFILFAENLEEQLRRSGQKTLLRVQMAIRAPNQHGLAEEDEIDDLTEIEDALEDILTARGACYVGRVSGGGLRTCFFYMARKPGDVEELVNEIMAQTGYELGYRYEQDPEFQVYRELLHPNEEERRVMQDMAAIEKLHEQGDSLKAARRIDHFASFDNRQQAESFARWARKEGFAIDRLAAPEDRPNAHAIALHHESCIMPEHVTGHTLRLAATAAKLGGTYNGWQTTVQP